MGNIPSWAGPFPMGVSGDENAEFAYMDWHSASRKQERARIIVPKWRDMYPPEILARELPTPATDIFMGAKTMLWAFPNMPNEMRLYFGVLSQISLWSRVSDLDMLLKNWDRLIHDRLGWPHEFVPFDFNLSVVNWEWWW